MAVGQGAMEDLAMNYWHGKRVLLTGHTGFKGAWLSLWLLKLGARVTGIALPPDTSPSLFEAKDIAGDIDDRFVDIRNQDAVVEVVSEVGPDVVFHLAAQSLVRRGYRLPVETWTTNVMGTAYVLEALRLLDKPCAAVLITTDKVYENREWEFSYRETDRLGGQDPYSASKAASEIVINCWRKLFLDGRGPVRIASARAGNVIGGGDWADDRIVPDMVRALRCGRCISVRNPHASRPWQHVLDPLGGYLVLAKCLAESDAPQFQDAYNFGPNVDVERTVRELVEDASRKDQPHEAGRLTLRIDRARTRLGWTPRWDFKRSASETIEWYRRSIEASRSEVRELSLRTIDAYEMLSGAEVTA